MIIYMVRNKRTGELCQGRSSDRNIYYISRKIAAAACKRWNLTNPMLYEVVEFELVERERWDVIERILNGVQEV